MKTVPDMRDRFDGRLAHVTTRAQADMLLRDGFSASRSYWGVGEVTDYYLEVVRDDGDEAVVLTVALDDLDAALLVPDMPSIEEPLSCVLKTTDDLVLRGWQNAAGTWRDCLDLVGSVAYDGRIPAGSLREERPADTLKRLGWTHEATHLYDEEAVEGWLWTDGSREISEVGAHDRPPEIPDELLALLKVAFDHAP